MTKRRRPSIDERIASVKADLAVIRKEQDALMKKLAYHRGYLDGYLRKEPRSD